MATLLLWLTLAVALVLSERSVDRAPFAVAAFTGIAAALLLFVGDLERSVLLAAVVVAAIVGASIVKYELSGIKLTPSDLALVFAGTLSFLVAQYRRIAITVSFGAVALALSAIAVLWQGPPGPTLTLEYRLLILVAAIGACATIYAINKPRDCRSLGLTQRRCFFSTFVAALVDVSSWWPSSGLRISNLASEPLPLSSATPARSGVMPDIIVIQHESIFDPRLFGLPVEPNVQAFLSPISGRSGQLHVDIFGGGSWQSEFSLITGLSSAIFGPAAYSIFRKGAGRFSHSLPIELSTLGYETTLVSSCRRSFLDYDAFYRSIGMKERIFSDDFLKPPELAHFEKTYSDALFLNSMMTILSDKIAAGRAPQFLYALTNFNHGPHDRHCVPSDRFVAEREFARTSFDDPQYVEYYVRLAETASTWKQIKAQLSEAFPERPMLIVHYGDHQPVMTRRIDRGLECNRDEDRQFRTFYAIEGLNFAIEPEIVRNGVDLDIGFLGTRALQAAGLQLDAVSATLARLMEDCGGTKIRIASDHIDRFHRTLVDMNLIDLTPAARHRK